MPVLNKPDLIAEIAEKTGESKAATERFLNAFQETVVDSVVDGVEVKISGFAAFSPSTRSARIMKNPRTGEDIEVPETKTVRMRVLKAFRDRISGRDM